MINAFNISNRKFVISKEEEITFFFLYEKGQSKFMLSSFVYGFE